MSILNVLLNVLWIIFGGLLSALCWMLAGVLCCITVVGIPVGLQCFKFAKLILMPFGKKVYFGNMSSGSVLLNVIWILLGGLGLCISSIAMGVGSCLTIIGIPFGVQHFKFAALAYGTLTFCLIFCFLLFRTDRKPCCSCEWSSFQ